MGSKIQKWASSSYLVRIPPAQIEMVIKELILHTLEYIYCIF